MGKFDKVKTNAGEVAKIEALKAQKAVIENVLIENLVPDPNNNEDISQIGDLVLSIEENGFLDPIVVTDFQMESGKYRIVSGHRRTEAMKFLKKTAIPCLIQHFANENEVANARQSFNNATRDSSKDPLLYVRRWMTWNETHGGMSETEKVTSFANNCGMSRQNAERYKSVAKIIVPIQQMLNDGRVSGISSLVPIAALKPDDQNELYNIMSDAYEEDADILTRPNIRKIVDAYKSGLHTWDAVRGFLFEKPAVPSHGEKPNGGPVDPPAEGNNEDGAGGDESNPSDEVPGGEENKPSEEAPAGNEEARRLKAGNEVKKHAEKLTDLLNDYFDFKSADETTLTVKSLMGLAELIVVNCSNCVEEMGDNGYDVFMSLKKELKDAMDNLS